VLPNQYLKINQGRCGTPRRHQKYLKKSRLVSATLRNFCALRRLENKKKCCFFPIHPNGLEHWLASVFKKSKRSANAVPAFSSESEQLGYLNQEP